MRKGTTTIQAARFASNGSETNTPWRRKFLIRCVHAPYYSLLCGYRITDTTNGFRAFSARFLQSADLALKSNTMSKYELPYFMSWVACRRGFRTMEIGVSRHYPASGEVPTKIVGVKGYWQMLKPLLLLTLWTLRLPLHPQAGQLGGRGTCGNAAGRGERRNR